MASAPLTPDVPVAVAAIDLDKLKAAAFSGTTPTVACNRLWLQALFHALAGETVAVVTAAPDAETRHAKLLQAVSTTLAVRP